MKRGMDITQTFLNKTGLQAPGAYVLSGISKRGWTTWLTSAISSRVIGAAPIVYDMINMNKCLHEQYRLMGGYSMAYYDYWRNAKLFNYMDTTQMDELASIIDPYGTQLLISKSRIKESFHLITIFFFLSFLFYI